MRAARHYGREWVQTVKGLWHYGESRACQTMFHLFEIVAVKVVIGVPKNACGRCARDYEEKRSKGTVRVLQG